MIRFLSFNLRTSFLLRGKRSNKRGGGEESTTQQKKWTDQGKTRSATVSPGKGEHKFNNYTGEGTKNYKWWHIWTMVKYQKQKQAVLTIPAFMSKKPVPPPSEVHKHHDDQGDADRKLNRKKVRWLEDTKLNFRQQIIDQASKAACMVLFQIPNS